LWIEYIFDDLLFRFKNGFFFLPIDFNTLHQSVVNEACSLFASLLLDESVFLILQQLHPFVEKLFGVILEVPLCSFKFSFRVFACVSDLHVVGGDWVGKGAKIDRHAFVFGVGDIGLERDIFEVIDVEDQTSFIIIDKQSFISQETNRFAFFLDKRIVEYRVSYRFLDKLRSEVLLGIIHLL
jgi:hypothetical protein